MPKKNHPVKATYPNGECPDCGEPLPEDVQVGDSCCNCGHVFTTQKGND